MTAEELYRYQPADKDTELIRGRMVVREPPSQSHGLYAANLCRIVATFVHTQRLGAVFTQDTGFQITWDPDTVLAPDLAFIRRERLRLDSPRVYGEVVPDLVAEILSVSERRRRAQWKMARWRAAGVSLGWLIEPRSHTATMYLADGRIAVVPAAGQLLGGDVLPGFACALEEVFEI